MARDKTSIILYGNMLKAIAELPAESCLEIMKAISAHVEGRHFEFSNPILRAWFTDMLETFKRDAENFKAVVVGTTGWNDIKDEVIAYFEKCGTPMIYASNFSIGVNVFFAVTDFISSLLGKTGGYSPYIVEKHHCHKLDAPSGTAKSLASIIDRNMGTDVDIQAVRCGEIPGIHTIGFEGINDRITMTHEAFSREGFARGAVEAALRTETVSGVHEFKEIVFK